MPIPTLLKGYRQFRSGYWPGHAKAFKELVAKGQHPRVCMVACSDSRIDPAHEFQAEPGQLFVVRNVANLVPPMEDDGGHHGTSAALEFAVKELEVENIIVLGHAHCGGVKAVMNPQTIEEKGYSFVSSWVSTLTPAARRVKATMASATPDERQRACEQQAIMVSLENLITFPWIAERVESGDLALHGWYFDIEAGELHVFDAPTNTFRLVEQDA